MLNVPVTWSSSCTHLEHNTSMADSSENLYLFGDDLEAILAILEDDEALEDQFSNAASDVSVKSDFCFGCSDLN